MDGPSRFDHPPKRSALQRDRLLRRGRQHLLRRQRRHHQPDRASRPVAPQAGTHRGYGRYPGLSRAQAELFGVPLLGPGALDGAIPSNDPYETNFIDHGQRNLPATVAEARGYLARENHAAHRAVLSQVYVRVFNLTNTASFESPSTTSPRTSTSTAFLCRPAGDTNPCDTSYTALYFCPTEWPGHHKQDHRQPAADSDVIEPHLLDRSVARLKAWGRRRARVYSCPISSFQTAGARCSRQADAHSGDRDR